MPDSVEKACASRNCLNALPEHATGRLTLADGRWRNIGFAQSAKFQKTKSAGFLDSTVDFNTGLKAVSFVA
jgi:hypothetical protein|tara:strand:+ start:35496 stop:35708 length:213 start_codon:yes stop_codon:yes gene_type:complete